jgi:hypothetical protein
MVLLKKKEKKWPEVLWNRESGVASSVVDVRATVRTSGVAPSIGDAQGMTRRTLRPATRSPVPRA